MQHTQHSRMFKFVATAATATIAAAMIAVGAPSASAADKTVTIPAGDNLYDPQDAGSMSSGDTITWKNDGVHDIKSARIPSGATAWSSPIQQGAATFKQTPTVAGNYRYYCSLHSDVAAANAATQDAGEMVGQFTVGGAAAAAPAPAEPAPGAAPAPQVPNPPAGGVQTGGGSTAAFQNAGPLMLGGGLLVLAFMSAMLGLRVARRD